MNDAIIVTHNPFDMESKINIIKNREVYESFNISSNIYDLAEALVNIAEREQIFTVKTSLSLPLKNELEDNIKLFENYSKNKITVEDI